MVSPFGCIFGFILFILAFLFIIVLNTAKKVKDIMSAFSPKKHKQQTTGTQSGRQETNHHNTQSSRHSSHKIFDDNEGEYVDYEEIK